MDLKRLIGEESARFDRIIRDDLGRLAGSHDPLLVSILEYALLGGGKRLRPLLTVLGSRLCGRDDEALYRLAVAFEYLHVATLCHDDIIDQADLRRGKAAVHQKFGTVGAILVGDFLHAWSMERIGELGGQEALRIFTGATRGMVDGEFVQMRNQDNFNQSEDDYYTVIMGKTALLIGAACEIGGIYGNGHREQRHGLRTYGLRLGCAFQIVDDLLDYQGQAVKTGKAVGTDLAEGKMTLPLILARQTLETSRRKVLTALLAESGNSQEKFTAVQALITEAGGFAEARRRAVEMSDQAREALDCFRPGDESESLAVMDGLAQYVISRER